MEEGEILKPNKKHKAHTNKATEQPTNDDPPLAALTFEPRLTPPLQLPLLLLWPLPLSSPDPNQRYAALQLGGSAGPSSARGGEVGVAKAARGGKTLQSCSKRRQGASPQVTGDERLLRFFRASMKNSSITMCSTDTRSTATWIHCVLPFTCTVNICEYFLPHVHLCKVIRPELE